MSSEKERTLFDRVLEVCVLALIVLIVAVLTNLVVKMLSGVLCG